MGRRPRLLAALGSGFGWAALACLLGGASALAGGSADALSSHTPSELARVRRGASLLFNGHWDRAEGEFSSLLREKPESPAGHFYLGMVDYFRLRLDDEDEKLAERYYDRMFQAELRARRLIAKDPGDALAHLYLGGALGFRAMVEAMRGEFLSAQAHAREGVRSLEKTIALKPESWDALLGLGLYNYYAARMPLLLRLLRALLFLPPGDAARGLAQLEEAEERGLLARPAARLHLVDIFARWEERPQLALGRARALAEEFFENPYHRLRLAFLLLRTGEAPRAEEIFRRLLAEAGGAPEWLRKDLAPRARLGLAYSLQAQGRREGSLEALGGLLAGPGPGPRYLFPLAHILAGDLSSEERRRSLAALHYQRALEASEGLGRTDWEARTLGLPSARGIGRRAQGRLEKMGSRPLP